MRFLRKFQEEGTIIFVSHDTGAVVNLCDRALLLENGVRKMEGFPKDVCDVYLESFFAENQETRKVRKLKACPVSAESVESIDQRIQYINASPCRNDIEVFKFDPESWAFGQGNAQIMNVQLTDLESGSPISWMVGGEKVSIIVDCVAHRPIGSPIIGFFVRDRLGQTLFGDNTYLTNKDCRLRVGKNECFRATFTFRMPILPVGEYSLTVAVAEGTQQEHVQHHWIHDALFFKSHTSSVCTGLVGVAMEKIVIEPLGIP